MSERDFEAVVEAYHQSADVFVSGDPEPFAGLWSRGDDITLANPFGPPVRGWDAVRGAMVKAAANYRDGGATGFERISDYATADLAYMLEIERFRSKVGGAKELSPIVLRVTTVFRREFGEWRLVHRHADPTTTAQQPEAVLGE